MRISDWSSDVCSSDLHFLRLYMVPGMGHSAEGPGATHFSSSTRDSVPPVSDATHDVKAALYAWVEKGEAPGALIATRYVDDGVDHAPGTAPIALDRKSTRLNSSH